MSVSYGNVSNTKLSDVISNPEFKKIWGITKEDVLICKSCEFRSVCTDCRAYIQDPDNILSKPLKCGYDPLTRVWSDWDKLKENLKGIDYYKFDEEVLS